MEITKEMEKACAMALLGEGYLKFIHEVKRDPITSTLWNTLLLQIQTNIILTEKLRLLTPYVPLKGDKSKQTEVKK